jgi:hypothetical protein
LFAHRKPYVLYKTMLERIVGTTSPSRNIYEIVDDNNNCYKSMMMNLMRMNYSYSSESLCR